MTSISTSLFPYATLARQQIISEAQNWQKNWQILLFTLMHISINIIVVCVCVCTRAFKSLYVCLQGFH